ncbi:hypothetical protein B0A50_06720 [Salinomyces thailandicus]|uniref:Uncharacterized protein n=1 Tax=Salinomyces thailandicus TaxID=706561 RepID=A0A4U0TQP6_9PEZI|nr:hypothetical protein B0A50_06720 [Salinomyces thailandica]
MPAEAPTGGPTPPQEAQPPNSWANYVPHDLKYSADFEDALVKAAVDGDAGSVGIRVLPNDSEEQPVDGISVRARDVSLQSLPSISEDNLPLSLDDSRRIFASPVPGVKLTHPSGYLEGGPGLDPEMDTFPDDFLSRHPTVTTAAQLRAAVNSEVDEAVETLKGRLRKRRAAKERNEQIEKELRALRDQHEMELKIHNRMREESERKKEVRERRRREREGG